MEKQTISIFSHVQNQWSKGHLYLQFQKISLEKPTPQALVFPPNSPLGTFGSLQCRGHTHRSFLKHQIAPFTVQLHFTSLPSYHLFFSGRHLLSFKNQQDNRPDKIAIYVGTKRVQISISSFLCTHLFRILILHTIFLILNLEYNTIRGISS